MAGVTKLEKKKESWGLVQMDKTAKSYYKHNKINRSITWKKKN